MSDLNCFIDHLPSNPALLEAKIFMLVVPLIGTSILVSFGLDFNQTVQRQITLLTHSSIRCCICPGLTEIYACRTP